MEHSKLVRNRLGITLVDFATIINCNYGQLTMAESGKRSLPEGSLAVIWLLEKLVQQGSSTPPPAAITDEKSLATLRRSLRTRKARLQVLQLKQEKLAEKLLQLQLLLQVAPLALAEETFKAMDDGVLQLQLLQRKAQKKVKQVQLQLAQLQVTIAGLTAEIAAATLLNVD